MLPVMARPSAQTAVRLEQELLDRIDRLSEKLSTPWAKVSRSDTMRADMLAGLPILEDEAERVSAARAAGPGVKPKPHK